MHILCKSTLEQFQGSVEDQSSLREGETQHKNYYLKLSQTLLK